MEKQQAESAVTSVPPEEEGTLREKIRGQVEYYLSRQNLLQDSYLVSKMDKDHFVDLSVIAEFKLIKQLTTDLDLILTSIKDSDKIVIDSATKRIKPSAINQRTTLILRNIPTEAERSAVESLLDGAKVPKILNLRSDVGNNWFATFETEEATKDAMEKAKKLKWGDKSIGVGIKSETGLSLGISSGQGTPSSNLPYYQSINSSSGAAYSGQNGGYSGYGSADGGHSAYRPGGRGGPGGRRGPGASSAAGAVQSTADGADPAKRQAGGKKSKPKGGREAGGRETSADVARGGAALPKEALNLADFPVLEANPLKKSGSSSGFGENAAVAASGSAANGTDSPVLAKDNAADSSSAGAATPPIGGSEATLAQAKPAEAAATVVSPSGSTATKKLSYAQMAQANASTAPATASASQPVVGGQSGSQGPAPAAPPAATAESA